MDVAGFRPLLLEVTAGEIHGATRCAAGLSLHIGNYFSNHISLIKHKLNEKKMLQKSCLSQTFVFPFGLLPQLCACSRLLRWADESQGLMGPCSLSSAESPVITAEWKADVGLAALGIGAGLSDIILFSRGISLSWQQLWESVMPSIGG